MRSRVVRPTSDLERRGLRALVATLLGHPVPFDPSELPLALVRRHLLAPLAYKAGVEALRKDAIASSLQAERRSRELRTVVDAFSERGIPVILLKGIAYAGSLYPDVADRPMSDIDLLVRDPDVPAAERELARLGYWRAGGPLQETVTRHAITFKHRDGAIDLHRHMLHAGRSRIDLESVWREARPSHHPSALRPSPAHEYLLHIAHIGRHEGIVPLINYVDAARLSEKVEQPDAFRLAADWAVLRACTAVTRAVRELSLTRKSPQRRMSFPAPDEILSLDLPPRWLQIFRKLRLIDDWRGFSGFAVSTLRSRVAPLRGRYGSHSQM